MEDDLNIRHSFDRTYESYERQALRTHTSPAVEQDNQKAESAGSASMPLTVRPTDSGDFDNDDQDEALIPCQYIQLIKREDVDQSQNFQRPEKQCSRVDKYERMLMDICPAAGQRGII